jgi:hypothetical protein
MIDGIRNWLGDIASGKIKDAQIALTQAEALVFKRQLDEAIAENARLATDNFQLASENKELKAQLADLTESADLIGEPGPYCHRNTGLLIEMKPKPGYPPFGPKQGFYKCNYPACGKSYDKEMRDL